MLIDTSVWIDHLRRPEPQLVDLLERNAVEVHPFVIGELACGHVRPRDALLLFLRDLPRVSSVDHEEAIAFVADHRLDGRGIGWVDVHLLASAMLARTSFWTRDRRLAAVARELRIQPHG